MQESALDALDALRGEVFAGDRGFLGTGILAAADRTLRLDFGVGGQWREGPASDQGCGCRDSRPSPPRAVSRAASR
jgi:hypothetical protein